jgi:hypothetical protein
MTAAQKAARVKFNKAIAIRKKTGCTLKEAFAQVYGKKVGAVKKKAPKKSAPKKKAVKKDSYHKDTKSHNVNIRVVSGVKKKAAKKKVGSTLRLSKGESKLGLIKKEPKKLGLAEQIGKIKMGSVFIYYKGFSIERMLLTIQGQKKKKPIFIVHEFGDTYKTLAAAKAAINHLGR